MLRQPKRAEAPLRIEEGILGLVLRRSSAALLYQWALTMTYLGQLCILGEQQDMSALHVGAGNETSMSLCDCGWGGSPPGLPLSQVLELE